MADSSSQNIAQESPPLTHSTHWVDEIAKQWVEMVIGKDLQEFDSCQVDRIKALQSIIKSSSSARYLDIDNSFDYLLLIVITKKLGIRLWDFLTSAGMLR